MSSVSRISWLLSTFALAALTAMACSNTASVSTGPTPVKCQVGLASSTSSLAPDGGVASLSITTQPECAWTASTSVSWISGLSPSTGQGSGQVQFQVAPNRQTAMREAEIVVNDDRFKVSQMASPCRFEVNPEQQTIPSAAGTGSFTIFADPGCAWTAGGGASWLRITSGFSGTANGTVSFAADANPGTARSATFTIAGETRTVTQAGAIGSPTPTPPPGTPAPVCTYSISPTGASVPASASSGSVTVTGGSGCAWSATSNAPSWLSVTSGASGSGNGSVGYSATANTGSARTGTLTIGGQTFTVSQAAAPVCAFSINPTSTSVAALGGSGSVTVTAGSGCSWSAASNAPSWLDITSGASGSGNGTVAYSVGVNIAGGRTGTLTIAGQTFTVTQAAVIPTCSFSIHPTSTSVAAAGGSGSVTVTAGSGCSWSATSNAPSWLSVTSGASGSGNGSVGYSAAANTGSARSGTITIAGQTFTVSQGN